MIMTKDTFLERLYVLFRDDKIRDAAGLFESLRDEMYAQEAEHEQRLKELAKQFPPTFGIQRMGEWNDVDAAGTFIKRHIAVERFKVREQDIPAFHGSMVLSKQN